MDELPRLSHEKLDVYQKSIQFYSRCRSRSGIAGRLCFYRRQKTHSCYRGDALEILSETLETKRR